MPDFAIVDAHVHLIDPERIALRWGGDAPALNRRHGMAEFDAARGQLIVGGIVAVEADVVPTRHLDEVGMIEEAAGVDSRIKAIVAHAPLEFGDKVAGNLDWLAERPLVRGVRRLLQGESDPEFCLQPGFMQGVRLLAGRSLHFEICILHHQAAAAVSLARRCPDVRFMLDHIAKPGIAAGLLDPWRAHIRQFAELPNVSCKLSGLITEADHASWKPADLRPYIDHVVECFGFDRVCFGSDWPVVNLAGTHARWVQTLDSALAGVAKSDLLKLYKENASEFYRLADQSSTQVAAGS